MSVHGISAHSRVSGNPDREATGSPLSRGRADESRPARLLALIGLTLALAYLIFLAGAYLKGDFLIDAQGRPIANDFVNVFAAGRLVIENAPAAAYDWTVHKAAEVRAVGYDFANYYGWHYPPTFLFVAAALRLLPYHGRLQSLFGFMRAHGAGETLAWTVQGAATVALAAGLVRLWRSRAPFELKAAALATGALLATPYLYMYDLAALAVAVAFLLRYALQRGFTPADVAGLTCAGALILSYPFLTTQVGLAAVLIVLALAVRHAIHPSPLCGGG